MSAEEDGGDSNKAILKMPAPLNREQKWQQAFEQAGCLPEELRVVEVVADDKGRSLRIAVDMTPEIANALIRQVGMKVFDPNAHGGIKVEIPDGIDSDKKAGPTTKQWSSLERRERIKPKGDVPDRS